MMSDGWNNLEGFDLMILLARRCQQIVSVPGVSFWSTYEEFGNHQNIAIQISVQVKQANGDSKSRSSW